MMTIFVTRLWCVKADPFVGNWSKRRQPKRRQTEASTHRNVDRPKPRQTKASTNQNVDIPKHRQTKTSTDQKSSDQNLDKPKRGHTKTSTDQNVDKPKRRQTETWTVWFSTLCSRVFVFIILGVYYIYIRTYCMTGWMYIIYQYPQLYNYYISTNKIKSIHGGIPGIILRVKDHFKRRTINTDVCIGVVEMCE